MLILLFQKTCANLYILKKVRVTHNKMISFYVIGFEISENQKRQAAMTVRKVSKQKGKTAFNYNLPDLTHSHCETEKP